MVLSIRPPLFSEVSHLYRRKGSLAEDATGEDAAGKKDAAAKGVTSKYITGEASSHEGLLQVKYRSIRISELRRPLVEMSLGSSVFWFRCLLAEMSFH